MHGNRESFLLDKNKNKNYFTYEYEVFALISTKVSLKNSTTIIQIWGNRAQGRHSSEKRVIFLGGYYYVTVLRGVPLKLCVNNNNS